MITLRIRCINKSDRNNIHERITHVGGLDANGSRWRHTQQQAIWNIEARTHSYYVHVNGKSVGVIVATTADGRKYLRTEADNHLSNNLLSLPECPLY